MTNSKFRRKSNDDCSEVVLHQSILFSSDHATASVVSNCQSSSPGSTPAGPIIDAAEQRPVAAAACRPKPPSASRQVPDLTPGGAAAPPPSDPGAAAPPPSDPGAAAPSSPSPPLPSPSPSPPLPSPPPSPHQGIWHVWMNFRMQQSMFFICMCAVLVANPRFWYDVSVQKAAVHLRRRNFSGRAWLNLYRRRIVQSLQWRNRRRRCPKAPQTSRGARRAETTRQQHGHLRVSIATSESR